MMSGLPLYASEIWTAVLGGARMLQTGEGIRIVRTAGRWVNLAVTHQLGLPTNAALESARLVAASAPQLASLADMNVTAVALKRVWWNAKSRAA